MNRFLLLSIFILSALTITAQNSFPDYKDSMRWTVCHTGYEVAGPGWGQRTFEYYFIDTIHLCGDTYSKIEEEGNLMPIDEGYVRNEGDKVYLRKGTNCDDKEYLLYDFGMEEEEIVRTVWRAPFGELKEVISILENRDTIGNEIIMNIYNFYDNDQHIFETQWIEGVGAKLHPFHPLIHHDDACECSIEYMCLLNYEDTIPDSCICNASYNNTNQNYNSLKFYPNPVQDKLHIASTGPIDQLQILDISGRIILNKQMKRNSISLGHLSQGIYLLRLYDTKGNTIIRKLVKE